MRRYLIVMMLIFSVSCAYSQNEKYHEIERLGKEYVKPIMDGHVENLKNANPPKNTWSYKRLVEYKEFLQTSKHVFYGSYIMPGLKGNTYSYNQFAYTKDENEGYKYFFVAIVNIDTSGKEANIDVAFLFTEEQPLTDWWTTTFGYYQSETSKEIPDEFMHPVCPPPPFRMNKN